jgi:hypothetical protein
MAWVRLEDDFPENPKIIEAGPVASWLHIKAIAFCNRQLTDGFVSYATVRWMNGAASAKVLVRVGLWETTKGGYLIHDYLEYQPSRAEVLDRREKRAASGKLGGLARAKQLAKQIPRQTPSPVPVPVPKHLSDASTPRRNEDAVSESAPFDFKGILKRMP